jgi:hypothetical protein
MLVAAALAMAAQTPIPNLTVVLAAFRQATV